MARFHSPLAGVRFAALAFSLCAAAPALAQTPAGDPNQVLATVNGEQVTGRDLAQAEEDVGSTLPRQMDAAARRKALMDYVIDLKLVTQKAAADKMDQTAEFKQKMAYLREKLLMEGFLGKIAKDSVTDAALKATYDEAAKAQKPEQEIHALHILVPTEKEALDVETRLKAGEDFGKLADQLSKDPGSKGGDLGWFTKDRMVPEFAEVAFNLKPGQISQPVKTQFGWHIIKVLEVRTKPFPPMDQVRDQLERFVAQRAQSQAIMKLREGSKITRADEPAADAKPSGAPK
jgi:peptidyl-prolyl cis-trans isomerase C